MKKTKLVNAVNENISVTKDALQLLWDNINKGQKKQLIKIPEIKELLDRYGVDYSN